MSGFTFKDNQAEDVGLIINAFMLGYFITQVFCRAMNVFCFISGACFFVSEVGKIPGTYSDALDSPVTYF
jgi:hypothetical protein